jgi:pilus assembly protein Flp/PilA
VKGRARPDLTLKRRVFVMNSLLRKFVRDESGATAIEYGLIASLIAVVIITAVKTVGTNLSTVFSEVSGNLK